MNFHMLFNSAKSWALLVIFGMMFLGSCGFDEMEEFQDATLTINEGDEYHTNNTYNYYGDTTISRKIDSLAVLVNNVNNTVNNAVNHFDSRISVLGDSIFNLYAQGNLPDTTTHRLLSELLVKVNMSLSNQVDIINLINNLPTEYVSNEAIADTVTQRLEVILQDILVNNNTNQLDEFNNLLISNFESLYDVLNLDIKPFIQQQFDGHLAKSIAYYNDILNQGLTNQVLIDSLRSDMLQQFDSLASENQYNFSQVFDELVNVNLSIESIGDQFARFIRKYNRDRRIDRRRFRFIMEGIQILESQGDDILARLDNLEINIDQMFQDYTSDLLTQQMFTDATNAWTAYFDMRITQNSDSVSASIANLFNQQTLDFASISLGHSNRTITGVNNSIDVLKSWIDGNIVSKTDLAYAVQLINQNLIALESSLIHNSDSNTTVVLDKIDELQQWLQDNAGPDTLIGVATYFLHDARRWNEMIKQQVGNYADSKVWSTLMRANNGADELAMMRDDNGLHIQPIAPYAHRWADGSLSSLSPDSLQVAFYAYEHPSSAADIGRFVLILMDRNANPNKDGASTEVPAIAQNGATKLMDTHWKDIRTNILGGSDNNRFFYTKLHLDIASNGDLVLNEAVGAERHHVKLHAGSVDETTSGLFVMDTDFNRGIPNYGVPTNAAIKLNAATVQYLINLGMFGDMPNTAYPNGNPNLGTSGGRVE